MRVRSGDVDNVDIGIFDEFFVGAVGRGGGGTFTGLEELFGTRGGG